MTVGQVKNYFEGMYTKCTQKGRFFLCNME